jgi:SAM-dependent methyltransferase
MEEGVASPAPGSSDDDAVPCPACGESRAELRAEPRGTIDKDGYRYTLCAGCGLASLDPLPRPTDAEALYDAAYFESGAHGGYASYLQDERIHRRNARIRLRRIGRVRPRPPGRILDIGCAAGFFLDECRRAGWEVEGLDVSSWARTQTMEQLGIPVADDLPALAARAHSTFDVVAASQVVEHAAHPDAMLRALHDLLRPDGLLFLETWDRGSPAARLFGSHWQQITPPSVIHLFDRRSLEALLHRAGFRDIHVFRAKKFVSVGFVTSLLGAKYRALGACARWMHGRRVGRFPLPYFLGDLIHVTATRDGT